MTDAEGQVVEAEGRVVEKDPNYEKQVHLFGIVAVGLLCVALVVSTFLRYGTNRKEEQPDSPQPLPIETSDPGRAGSEDNFRDRMSTQIEQERSSRQISETSATNAPGSAFGQNAPHDSAGRPARPGAVPRSGSPGSSPPNQYQAQYPVNGADPSQWENEQTPAAAEGQTIEDEFNLEEKKRALLARRSKFDLKPVSDVGEEGQPLKRFSKVTGEFSLKTPPEGLDAIELEKQRVQQEIARVEKKLKNPALLSQLQTQGPKSASPFSLGSMNQAGGAAAEADAADQDDEDPADEDQGDDEDQNARRQSLTIGRPASEAAREQGQVLIATGTVISGVLDQQLMSDYVGPFRGLVTHDVYDVSGNYIVIPKGARITGRSLRISNVNEPIQARMGLAVNWIVLPNGRRISFEKKSAALDQAGVPAVKDRVAYHFLAQFLGVAAYAMIASDSSYEGSGGAEDQTFEGNLGGASRKQFSKLAAKYLELVPTITLRSGTPIKVFIEDDIYARPWEDVGKKMYNATRPIH